MRMFLASRTVHVHLLVSSIISRKFCFGFDGENVGFFAGKSFLALLVVRLKVLHYHNGHTYMYMTFSNHFGKNW